MADKYKNLTEEEKRILDMFPVFTAQEVDQINGLFEHYIFYKTEKKGRVLSTTCCHRYKAFYPKLQQTETPEHWELIGAKHNEKVTCPFCGRRVMLRAAGRKCLGINQYINIVMLHNVEGALLAQAYSVRKRYSDGELKPHIQFTSAYHFQIGRALQFYETYGGQYFAAKDENKILKRSNVKEPFKSYGLYSRKEPYIIIHPEAIGQSGLRYCGYFEFWRRGCNQQSEGDYTLMRFLSAYCVYPRAVEMLLKSGMRSVVDDFIFNGRKNASAMKWTESDPRRAFGLNGGELKQFMAQPKREIEYVTIYKKLRKAGIKTSFGDLGEMKAALGYISLTEFVDASLKRDITPKRFYNYLDSFAGARCHGGGVTFDYVYRHWKDYITAADAIGYDLTQYTVRFPKRLQEAHDNATAEHNRRLVEEREEAQRQQEEQRRKDDEARAKRDPKFAAYLSEKRKQEDEERQRIADVVKNREKKYTWEAGEFIIRPARSSAEIITEGNLLSHCVGGYAERHMTGKLTICFLRPSIAPDTPFVTVELDTRGRMIQVHGYKNDQGAEVKADKAFANVLNPWLAWIAAGSKRDKQGNPIIKNKTKTKEANVA